MPRQKNRSSVISGGELAGYAALFALSAAIAYFLPSAINNVLYRGWPWLLEHPDVLLGLQVGIAAMLMALFVAIKNSLHFVDSAKLASLVHASRREGAMTPQLLHKLPTVQQACVLTVTGHDTFGHAHSQFRRVLEEVREVRVMLLNPLSEGARLRADSLSGERDYYGKMLEELHDSIAVLRELRRSGKRVVLKFYDNRPFWKLVIIGGYVWVQYCHDGVEVSSVPEYVFAQPSDGAQRGLYTPFNMLFEEKWSEMPTVDFDFETDELVKRDATGSVLERVPLPHSPHAGLRAIARHSQCALTGYIPNQA
jgi:hypothetical protein